MVLSDLKGNKNTDIKYIDPIIVLNLYYRNKKG